MSPIIRLTRHRVLAGPLVVILLVIAAALGGAGTAAASAARPYCGITWGSLPRVQDGSSSAGLVGVRTGRHDCYDRVVFDFQGYARGYAVQYTDQVVSQGRGEPLTVAGGARLNVLLHGPPTYAHGVGDHVADVAGYRTLRDVIYGGSFEGDTTVGIGVRARLPFRVFTLSLTGTSSRIVIDVAHRWAQ